MSILHSLSHVELLALLDRIGVYDVQCDRCGIEGLSCDFIVEEGDEWECWKCYERCEASERAREAFRRSLEKFPTVYAELAKSEAADLTEQAAAREAAGLDLLTYGVGVQRIAPEEFYGRAEFEARKQSAQEDYQG